MIQIKQLKRNYFRRLKVV